MSRLSIKMVSSEEADSRTNTLNVLFRMYDIGLTAKYHQTDKGVRRPWRLHRNHPVKVHLEKDTPLELMVDIRYFETAELMENFAHKIIRGEQARAELSLV